MAYSQERIDNQPLSNTVNFGQQMVVQMATNLADTKHNKFDTELKWNEVTEEMMKCMTELIEMETRLDNSAKATAELHSEIRQMIASGEKISDISEIDDKFDQKLAEFSAANQPNLDENVNMKKLKELLNEFAEEGDDDIETVEEQEERIPIDPFSKLDIENPVKNKKCGHVYDGDQLRKVLQGRAPNQKQRCPYVGCNNRAVTLEDCEVDHKTKALIQRLRKD